MGLTIDLRQQNSDGNISSVFENSITHNLRFMAIEAGIYNELWNPEKLQITTAKQLINPLSNAIRLLKTNPDRFQPFSPVNGWGDYNGFVTFIEQYLIACIVYPDATVHAYT